MNKIKLKKIVLTSCTLLTVFSTFNVLDINNVSAYSTDIALKNGKEIFGGNINFSHAFFQDWYTREWGRDNYNVDVESKNNEIVATVNSRVATEDYGKCAWWVRTPVEQQIANGRYYYSVKLKATRDLEARVVCAGIWSESFTIKKDEWITVKGYVNSDIAVHYDRLVFGISNWHTEGDWQEGDQVFLKDVKVQKV